MKGQNIRQLGIIRKFIEASSRWFTEFIGFWISAVRLFGKNDGLGQHWMWKGNQNEQCGTLSATLFSMKEETSVIQIRNQFRYLESYLCWTPRTQQDKFRKTIQNILLLCFWHGCSYSLREVRRWYINHKHSHARTGYTTTTTHGNNPTAIQ